MKREHRRQLLIVGIFTILFCFGGFALITWGFFKYVDARNFVSCAHSAKGKVVGFETYDAPGSDIREDIHYAMVRYRTVDGQEVLFRGPSKDSLVKLKRGDEVNVLYYRSNPQDARVDSFMGLWFAATMLWILGGGAILVPSFTMWQAWKWVKQQK